MDASYKKSAPEKGSPAHLEQVVTTEQHKLATRGVLGPLDKLSLDQGRTRRAFGFLILIQVFDGLLVDEICNKYSGGYKDHNQHTN